MTDEGHGVPQPVPLERGLEAPLGGVRIGFWITLGATIIGRRR